MDSHTLLTILAGIGLLALLSQWLAAWLRLPSILLLLGAGILAGPLTGWLEPQAVFGDLLFPIVSLSVAVILFEGSLTLRFEEIRGHGTVVSNMVTVGFGVTWAITAVAAHWLVGLDWPIAILFGAIMVVTGPTVVQPMLRSIRPNSRITNILRWEGILIDPVGAILALLVFEFIATTQPQNAIGDTLAAMGRTLVLSGLTGVLAGFTWGLVLRRMWLPESLHNIGTLLAVFVTYAAADIVQAESGLLAVTVMGVWLANTRGLDVDDILDFNESLSILLISGLFIILAARLDLANVAELGIAALSVLAVMQFVARPLKVWLCAIGAELSWREKLMIAWIGPRGIVAAAISAVFALRLENQGYADAATLVPLTFAIVVGTVVWQSLTAPALAHWLGVAEPEPEGVLVVGSNRVARAIAQALHDAEFRVLIADSYWNNIREARMAGLPTYYGNPMSADADRSMDLAGIGRLLALSQRHDFNIVACTHFREQFGRDNVYSLRITDDDDRRDARHLAHERLRGRLLFGDQYTNRELSKRLGEGWRLKLSRLTDDFGLADYEDRHPESVPLFAWESPRRLFVFGTDESVKPSAGWKIISLVPPSETNTNGDATREAEPAMANQGSGAA